MYPWLIEQIERQKQERESEKGIQPSLPVPEPYPYPQEVHESPRSGSVIVNFEL